MSRLMHLLVLVGLTPFSGWAADWPQFRGANRDNVWNETGILQRFPAAGLKFRWSASVGPGNSSPVVADGRVCLTDSESKGTTNWERIHCFEEATGKRIWTHRYPVDFAYGHNPDNPTGPCPTPAIDDGRVFTLGSIGHLSSYDVRTGKVLWRKNLAPDYNLIEKPNLTACPLVDGNRLILVIGGKPNACVVALDKRSGREIWRALGDRPRAYSSPIIIKAGGQRQLIVWTPESVSSLNPLTGETWWRERLNTREDYAGATPVFQDDLLLVSGLMFQLGRNKPAAKILWPERLILSQRVLSNTCMPMIRDGLAIGADFHGKLQCRDARTGRKLWEAGGLTGPERYGSIHLTPNGNSVFLYTDQGNLIRARLDRTGCHELSRVHLLEPTLEIRGRKVVWSPPAYANGHIFARNHRKLICASLREQP